MYEIAGQQLDIVLDHGPNKAVASHVRFHILQIMNPRMPHLTHVVAVWVVRNAKETSEDGVVGRHIWRANDDTAALRTLYERMHCTYLSIVSI